jgi:2-dehydropantoate 2-reductase
MCGGDIRTLARTPSAVRLFVRSYREALRALRSTGTPIVPRSTRLVEWIPEPLLVFALRFFLDTNLAVVGGQRHANAAPDEMKEIADEFREIMRRAGIPTPASDVLFPEVDKRLEASQRAGVGVGVGVETG